jgi:hypothetical protein
MKLSMEQHDELLKMAHCFDRIEELANHLGVEVDELSEELSQSNNSVMTFKKNLQAIAAKRRQIFTKSSNERNAETSIVNLSVLVNEDRFPD